MPGARNPKEVRLSLTVTSEINERLERLCDVAGMNKGAMTAVIIAAGLRELEESVLGVQTETIVRAMERLEQRRKEEKRAVVEASEG